MKIFLDAGHNHSGQDTGAEGCGLKEQDITYQIAQKIGDILASNGIDVKYSRPTFVSNVGTTLSESINGRVNMANNWGADYLISIHCNAASESANGTETLIYSQGGQAEKLADTVNSNLVGLGLTNRGVKVRTDLGVLKRTSMPAILIETAFITNPFDADMLISRQDDIAQAICNAILNFLGIEVDNMEHWAQKYFDFLKEKGYDISETRFDEPLTRGEAFKLLALIVGYTE